MEKTMEEKMREHKILRDAQNTAHECWLRYLDTQNYEDLKKYNEYNDRLIDIIWERIK